MFTRKYSKFILSLMAVVLYSAQFLAVGEAAPGSYYKKGKTGHRCVRVQAAKQVYPKRAYSKQTSGVENKQPKNVNEINQVPSGIVADQIIQTGEKYLGTPYRYGTSNGRTFDCSGFIRFIFAQHGITLPSGSYNQAKIGTTVSRSELQKGDLIFFRVGNSSKIGHVAVYAGNNKVLHTYQPGVKYDSLDAPWLKQGYVTAKRVL